MLPEQESWEEQERSGCSYYYDFVCTYEFFSLMLVIFLHKLFSSHSKNICWLSIWILYINRAMYLITSRFFVFYMKILLVKMCMQFLRAPLKSDLLELLFFFYFMLWFMVILWFWPLWASLVNFLSLYPR